MTANDLLHTGYPLDDSQISSYRRDGFVKLKDVLSDEVLANYRDAITQEVDKAKRKRAAPDNPTTYDKAFVQVTNLWRQSETVAELVMSPRMARIATELMGTNGVRLYHDQALFKQSSGGHTPWHADQYYWPLANSNTVTAWIPLQQTDLEMGPLEFSTGSHTLEKYRDLEISDESEKQIGEMLSNRDDQHRISSFEIGEVSFHNGWLFHRAGPNRSGKERKVFCIIYMDADMRLAEPANKAQELDRRVWCPGVEVGEVINSELNPIVYNAQ